MLVAFSVITTEQVSYLGSQLALKDLEKNICMTADVIFDICPISRAAW